MKKRLLEITWLLVLLLLINEACCANGYVITWIDYPSPKFAKKGQQVSCRVKVKNNYAVTKWVRVEIFDCGWQVDWDVESIEPGQEVIFELTWTCTCENEKHKYKAKAVTEENATEYSEVTYDEWGVGGYVIPVDKIGLLAPYIGLASTTIIALTATIIYVKRFKHKKQKQ